MAERRQIHCCGCGQTVDARLTNGGEVYPHRPDLWDLPFWRCDACGNFVGCHHKTAERTRPLGFISTPALRSERQKIHSVIDPLWKSGKWKRGSLYAEMTARLGRRYHTAEIRSVDEARQVLAVAQALAMENQND